MFAKLLRLVLPGKGFASGLRTPGSSLDLWVSILERLDSIETANLMETSDLKPLGPEGLLGTPKFTPRVPQNTGGQKGSVKLFRGLTNTLVCCLSTTIFRFMGVLKMSLHWTPTNYHGTRQWLGPFYREMPQLGFNECEGRYSGCLRRKGDCMEACKER